MKPKAKPEDVATNRVMMITPLLDASLDPHQLIQRKKEISEKHHVSYRTIDRYYQAYLTKGFEGLKPKISYKQSESTLPENYSEIVEQSIQLRKECPTRSVKDIIKILELESVVPVGMLSRSTLQRHLQASGFGARQVQMYQKKGAASRRFQKQHRGNLYQGDIKYGPYLPIGKDGAKKQVYLSAWIDDATRYIVSAKFYDNQTVDIIEDSLRNAIMHFGKPDAVFVDNGKQFRSEWMKKACAKLGIRLLFAKPYHPEGKGKIEFFNRRIDSFLSEVALDKVENLEQLNQKLDLWINEYYHKNPHYGLGQISPETAFRTDTRPLSFLDVKACMEAFLHTEEREVDKSGCISFAGKKYEVGLQLMGRKVEVWFDPTWTDEVEIHHKDFEPFKVKELTIGANCGARASLPEFYQATTATSSRLLDGLQKLSENKQKRTTIATSFRKVKEDNAHV